MSSRKGKLGKLLDAHNADSFRTFHDKLLNLKEEVEQFQKDIKKAEENPTSKDFYRYQLSQLLITLVGDLFKAKTGEN